MRNKRITKVLLTLLVLASLLIMGCSKDPNAPTTQGLNLTAMQADITALKSSFAVIQTTMAAITPSSAMVKQADFEQLKSTVTALQAAVNAIKPPSDYVTTAQLEATKAQVTALQTKVADFTAQITALQGKDNAQQTDLDALKSAATALQTTTAALQNSVTSLQTSITALQSKDTDLQSQINALKTSVAALATTTTPPTTTTTLTAQEAIDVTITPLGGISPIVVAGTSPQSYYLTLAYVNTTNKQYTNVKFKITAYDSSFTTVTSQVITPIAPTTPLWVFTGNVTTVYNYQTLSGITINANATGELILQITVTYTGTGSIFPTVSIV